MASPRDSLDPRSKVDSMEIPSNVGSEISDVLQTSATSEACEVMQTSNVSTNSSSEVSNVQERQSAFETSFREVLDLFNSSSDSANESTDFHRTSSASANTYDEECDISHALSVSTSARSRVQPISTAAAPNQVCVVLETSENISIKELDSQTESISEDPCMDLGESKLTHMSIETESTKEHEVLDLQMEIAFEDTCMDLEEIQLTHVSTESTREHCAFDVPQILSEFENTCRIDVCDDAGPSSERENIFIEECDPMLTSSSSGNTGMEAYDLMQISSDSEHSCRIEICDPQMTRESENICAIEGDDLITSIHSESTHEISLRDATQMSIASENTYEFESCDSLLKTPSKSKNEIEAEVCDASQKPSTSRTPTKEECDILQARSKSKSESITEVCDFSQVQSTSRAATKEECGILQTESPSKYKSETEVCDTLQTPSTSKRADMDECDDPKTSSGSKKRLIKHFNCPRLLSKSANSFMVECNDDPKQKVQTYDHEKGNCCVFIWSIDHFDTCMYIFNSIGITFSVNGRAWASWEISLNMKNESNPDMIGLRVTCCDFGINAATFEIAAVKTDGQLYRVSPCFLPIQKFSGELLFKEFLDKHCIFSNPSTYLHHGTLKIRCAINMEARDIFPKCFPSFQRYRDFGKQNLLARTMVDIFDNSTHSDAICRLSHKEVNVHKAVLCVRSPVFYNMFLVDDEAHDHFNFRDIDGYTAIVLLLYLYTANPYLIGCLPLDILQCAQRHDLHLLEHFAEPNVIYGNTRPRVQRFNLMWKIKNFSRCKRTAAKYEFFVDSFKNEWEFALSLTNKQQIDFELRKLRSINFRCKVDLQLFAHGSNNCYNFLLAESFSFKAENSQTFAFSLATKSILGQDFVFLPKGHLTLRIALQFSHFSHTNDINEYEMILNSDLDVYAKKKIPLDYQKLINDMKVLYASKYFSNFSLRSAGNEFLVHKCMLAPASPLLQTLFQTRREAGTLEMDNNLLDPVLTEKVAAFFYSGQIEDVSVSDVLNLIYAAEKYDIPLLREECLIYYSSILSVENAEEIYRIANLLREYRLKDEAWKLLPLQYHKRNKTI